MTISITVNKRKQREKKLFSILSVALILVIWQLISLSWDDISFYPTPIRVITEFYNLITTGDTYIILLTTLKRLLIALAISTVLGTFFGLFSGLHHQVEGLLAPIVVALRTTPVISIVVILLMMYGNVVSLYIIVFLLLFPIIYQSELDGIKNIDKTLLEVLKLDCDRCNIRSVRMVFFPMALPHLRTGILQSIGLGIKVLVLAEFIAQTKISIGRELQFSKISLNYANIFAWTIILIIFVSVVEHYVNRYLKYSKL